MLKVGLHNVISSDMAPKLTYIHGYVQSFETLVKNKLKENPFNVLPQLPRDLSQHLKCISTGEAE